MRRRALGLLVMVVLLAPMVAAHADNPRIPVPEGGVVQQVPGASCEGDSRYEPAAYAKWYVNPDGSNACKRMRIVFGPILVKPGQNDVFIQPVTIEKPQYDGYMIRFRPGLIEATGLTPPVEQLHLHHGTWLNPNYVGGNPFATTPLAENNPFRSYGAGPWLATGEEKTVVAWPKGYGLLIKATDSWLFLHMVHNATDLPKVVYATYDIDYVDASAPAAASIRNTKGIWLDVGGGKFHSKTETYPANPVYNVMRYSNPATQQHFGHFDAETGRWACMFPSENCSSYDSLGNPAAQQGIDVSGQIGTDGLPLKGMDFKIPTGFLGPTGVGTLVLMGGHLHNGGIRDEVSIVRKNADGSVEDRLIHVSDAYYWNHNPALIDRAGADPDSWDFAMTGTGADFGWKILVHEGDILRINALYDTELGAWWENMGIVMTWVAPGETDGTDMFAKNADGSYVVNIDRRVPVTVATPTQNQPLDPTGPALPGGYGCEPSATLLCVRGQVTHGHYASSDNHGACSIACPAFPAPASVKGPLLTDIHWGDFTFGESDFGVISVAGVPRVRQGSTLTFWNADASQYMPHTATACGFPCTGPTTVDYPISNGSYATLQPNGTYSVGGQVDFDSSELAYGLGPANRASWALGTGSMPLGVYTYYCRIHPTMRGAFEVVPANTAS
jgi:plastocyanin